MGPEAEWRVCGRPWRFSDLQAQNLKVVSPILALDRRQTAELAPVRTNGPPVNFLASTVLPLLCERDGRINARSSVLSSISGRTSLFGSDLS